MKNKKNIFITITLSWTAVIFFFSLQSGDISGDMSGSLIETILAFFTPGVLENPELLEVFHLILRKCAHFTEFMILGLLARNTMRYMEVHFKGVCALSF